ncbi:hypothetical protein FRZ03_02030 [Streptomyces misionensis]|uniref:Uncharacterized protein n=1 Tax=Streptomyces misionensis TaxID=67331 RepID=A0A5C6K4T4_9ACTN|nr:hypothetical protein [Streptomyces misionensis]TWV57391.1 hypothetical protein FRZ03_02030 [Streptomyces misionensis]
MTVQITTAVPAREADWEEFLGGLAAAVAAADPGTAYDWEARERMRFSAWVRHVYDDPRAVALFARPEPAAAAEARRREAAALAERLDAGRTVARPVRPGCEVWAAAATAAMWEITGAAVRAERRPPREHVVSDVWTVVRTLLLPAVDRFTPVFRRARGSW